MHLKQQQRSSYLQERIVTDLHIRLNKKTTPAHAVPAPSVKEEAVSFRWAWSAVLITGGTVAILLALLQREDPNVVGANLNATLLALTGVGGIVAGCLILAVGKHRKAKGRPL